MANNLRSITELPVLTEVPDGTYTVVVDGSTAKLAPYGGGGAEAIEITYTTADMQTFTCDKTFTEIREKLVVGKGIASIKIAVANAGILAAASSWSFLDRTNFGGTAKFVATYDDGNNFIRVIHANDETITVTGLA